MSLKYPPFTRQNEQLESYGLSREQLTTNRRRLRILQVTLTDRESVLNL